MTISSLGLAKAVCEESGWEMSNVKLQKISYIINGMYLAEKGTPMVDEKFQKWPYGPVLPSLYHKFKKFKAGKIANDDEIFADVTPVNKQTEEYEFIERTVKALKDLSPAQLINFTHKTGTAWQRSADGQIINDDLIKSEFSGYRD